MLDYPLPIMGSEAFFNELKRRYETILGGLPQDEFVIALLPLSSGESILIDTVFFRKPDMLRIQGSDQDKNIVVVVAHYQTCPIVFKISKITPDKPKPEIGFKRDQ